MKIRTSIIIEKSILKRLKKEAIDNDKSFSGMLEEILKNHYYKKDMDSQDEKLKDMF